MSQEITNQTEEIKEVSELTTLLKRLTPEERIALIGVAKGMILNDLTKMGA